MKVDISPRLSLRITREGAAGDSLNQLRQPPSYNAGYKLQQENETERRRRRPARPELGGLLSPRLRPLVRGKPHSNSLPGAAGEHAGGARSGPAARPRPRSRRRRARPLSAAEASAPGPERRRPAAAPTHARLRGAKRALARRTLLIRFSAIVCASRLAPRSRGVLPGPAALLTRAAKDGLLVSRRLCQTQAPSRKRSGSALAQAARRPEDAGGRQGHPGLAEGEAEARPAAGARGGGGGGTAGRRLPAALGAAGRSRRERGRCARSAQGCRSARPEPPSTPPPSARAASLEPRLGGRQDAPPPPAGEARCSSLPPAPPRRPGPRAPRAWTSPSPPASGPPPAVHTHAYGGPGPPSSCGRASSPRGAGASPALRGSRARHRHKMSALTELLPAPRSAPPASSPPQIRPPTLPARAHDQAPGRDGFLPTSGPRLSVLPASPSPRNSTFLLNRSEVGLRGRGLEAGHGLGGRGDERRKPLNSEKHREPEGDHGRKVMEAAAAQSSPMPLPQRPPISSLGTEEADLARLPNRSCSSAMT